MFTKENSVLSKQSTVAFIVVYAILSTVAGITLDRSMNSKRQKILNCSCEQLGGHVRCAEEQEDEDGQEHLHLQPRLLRPSAGTLSPVPHHDQTVKTIPLPSLRNCVQVKRPFVHH